MKVTILHAGWLNAPNGASSVLRTLLNNIETFGSMQIELNSFTMDDISPKKFRVNSDIKSKTFYVRFVDYIKNRASTNAFFALILIYGYYLRHAQKISKKFCELNQTQDIVFLHDIFTSYYYLRHKKKTLNQPKTVLVLHNNGDTYNMLKHYYKTLEKSLFYNYFLHIEKKVLLGVDKVGFVAKAPMENFKILHPDFPEDKLFFVYNGLPPSVRKPITVGTDCYKLVCVGSISERKGQRLIIEALNRLEKERRKKIQIVFVGDGELRKELELLTKEYQLTDIVEFVGISFNVDDYLRSSNIFICLLYAYIQTTENIRLFPQTSHLHDTFLQQTV